MDSAQHGRRFQSGGRETSGQGKGAGARGRCRRAGSWARVHASPEYLTQTVSMALGAVNDRGRGLNANNETCLEADNAVWRIVYGMIAYLEAEPQGSFT